MHVCMYVCMYVIPMWVCVIFKRKYVVGLMYGFPKRYIIVYVCACKYIWLKYVWRYICRITNHARVLMRVNECINSIIHTYNVVPLCVHVTGRVYVCMVVGQALSVWFTP